MNMNTVRKTILHPAAAEKCWHKIVKYDSIQILKNHYHWVIVFWTSIVEIILFWQIIDNYLA